MKTISKRFLKSGLALLLAFVMLFGTTITGFAAVVDNAETGGNISANTYFYWENKDNWTDSTIQLMVGHSSWSQGYKMTKISNTNLYYVKMPSWGGCYDLAVFGVTGSSAWNGEGNSISNRKSWATHSTIVYNSLGNTTLSGSYLLDFVSSSQCYTKLNNVDSLDYAQKAYVYSAPSGSSNFSGDSNAGTVTVSAYEMTGDTAAGSVSPTLSGYTYSFNAALSTEMTLTASAEDGYNFVGWYDAATGGTLLSSSAEYAVNRVTSGGNYYARFQADPKYSVTYNANGGSGVPDASTNLTAGSEHTVSSKVPTYTGYNFKGWNTTANGSGASYTAGQTITVNSDITLYAQWAKVHTVTYNANGGSGAPAKGSVEDGSDYTISSTTPTKANYNFTGWKDQNGAIYNAGATISEVSSDITLTAQWELAGVCSPVMPGLELEINETGEVEATTNDFCTGGKTFTYSLVDGGEYITLNGQTITPKHPGTAHVKATCSCGEEVTCAVTVKEPVLDINPEEVALLIGQSMTDAFEASANVGNPTVTFASKNTSVATVANGKATAVAEGNVDIEASLKFNDDYTATICAKVSVSTPSITANPTSVALEFGEGATNTSKTVTLETNAAAGNGTGDTITVTSANANVATATISGNTVTITATGVGSTTVTAKFHNATVEIPVTVTQYDPYVYLYVTDNNSWGSMYVYSWKGSNTVVTPITTSMIYIGKNGDGQNIFAYRFSKTNLPENVIFAKNSSWGSQTADTAINWNNTNHRAFYFASNSDRSTMTDWTDKCMIVRPTVSVADVVVPVAGTETATATIENGGVVYWTMADTDTATVANVTTATATVTGVTPGDTTISARAFVDTANSSIKTLPTNYKTQTSCWPYISTEATATVTVGSVDYNITASTKYSNNGTAYDDGTNGGTATITVDGENEGTSAAVAHGKDYTLTANANSGYRFVGWYIGDTQVSTEDSHTVNAKAAASYTAKFVKTFSVSVLLGVGIESIEYNDVTSTEDFDDITVDAGATIEVDATPSVNYSFQNWTDANGDIVSSNSTYTIDSVNADVVLTANAVPTYTATATAQTNKYFGTYGGTVTINGESSPIQCLAGDTVTFNATPNPNYYFAGWYSDAEFTEFVSAAAEYQATMTVDGITLYGLFVKKFFITKSDDSNLAEFVYDIATNTYTVTAAFTDHLTITSNDKKDVTAADVNVAGGTHTGCTVAGHYTSYQVTPDTENYDITAPVTYTLTPDMNSQGDPDGTYTMSIALQAATKVEISVNGTKVADKAIGSTFSYEIDAPNGQYLSSVTTTPEVNATVVDNTVSFTVPDENVNIVPSFADYSYVELFDSTGITATGLKTGYKAGEAVSITLSPASEATTISQVVANYDGAVITQNGDNWTVTIASMPADTTVTLTPTVDAKFVMNYGMKAIGNYGTGVTSGFGTVSMSIGGTTLANGYAGPNDTVTYTATESNANYVFAGFYSDEECEDVLSYELTYEVKPTKDTTVYTLWARRQYMDFDSGTTNIVKELTYDKEERVYTLSTVLADDSSANAISKGAWFQVTNDTNSWTAQPSYHHFGSDFSVTHNAKGFDATITWNDGGDSWKLSTSAANDTAIKFILTPTGNTAIDFSAQVGEVGSYVYLSSGRLDLPGSYNATVFEATSNFTTEGIENPTDTYVANEGENREKYKRISVSEAQTLTWETEITGTVAANYEVNSFVVYFIGNEEKPYEIVTPVPLGSNKYSGSVYVDGPCYIVPIYFLTSEYAQDNNLAEIDIYFEASAIKDKAWGPFVACYAWGSNNAEYHGGWSGQMMIPTADGKSFYTMLTVPKAGVEGAPSIPNGVTFNNYTQSTVPGSNPGAFGISATQYQCYDYREPITLYEAGYDVITFVAKDSTDGYHGDRANGVTANTITSATTDIFNKYHFDYLYSRDGVTPMDFNGDTIENVSKVEGATNADYYVIAKGDITYDPNGTKYVGDAQFDADWAVDWYIFDSNGNYQTKILSTAMWHDKDNNLENLYTYLHEALGTDKDGVAGKTVAISYEHENNAGHQVSYDGQWYGNYLQDTVKGQVKVGFQDSDGNITINPDEETPNIANYGEGYLVDSEGAYQQSLDILIDYGIADLHAERKDGYVFVGWFTQLADGSYKKISNAFDCNPYINFDETYYAIFRDLGEGEVVINHSTYVNPNDPAIPSHGGVAEMSIVVTDTTINQTFNCTPSTSRTSVAFPGIEDHTYTVTITTTPLMNGEFFAWYTDSYNADGTKTYEEVFTREDVFNSTSTVTATFEYTYTPGSQKIINIYSDVKRVTNSATLVYKYYNRFGELRTYTVYDVPLTDEECLGFVGNGGKQYVPAYITAYKFLYNNNEEVVVYGEDRYKEYAGNTDYTFLGSYNKVSAYAPSSDVTEVFDGTVQWIISDTTLTTESSLVTLVADQGTPDYVINYTIGAESGSKTGKYNELINITAPTTLNGQEFSYWYEPATGEILTYSVFYNYRIVEDKRIEAVYGQTNLPEWVPSINSIVTTREFADGGDYIYTDHLLAFNNKQGLVLKDVQSAKGIEYGLMVLRDADEYIDDLNEANNAKYADNTDKNWNTIVERLKTIASVRRKNSAFTIDGNKYNCYFYNLSQSQMTNFNRLDYYIKYDNEKLVDETHYYREYALTAVAYIIVDGTVYLSNPKNTNFYELGNKEVTDSTN